MFYFIKFLIFIVFFTVSPASAQDGTAQRVEGSATIINSINLSLNNKTVRLTGLNQATTRALGYDLIAQQALQDLIGGQDVTCIIRARGIGQCFNARGRDIGLSMLQTGYAFLDRPAIKNADYRGAYEKAGRDAQIKGAGLWQQIKGDPSSNTNTGPLLTAGTVLQSPILLGIIAALIAGPLIGMLFVGWIQFVMLGRLVKLQKHQIASNHKQERVLKDRERFVVSAALEGEINTNKAKLDAFLIIYEEMLRGLKDPTKTPKYKGGGDVVHEKPTLIRTVYDSNLDKLELLGTQLVADLTRLYVAIDASPDYITLEPDMPVEQVINIVQKIVNDARALREPMDQIAAGMAVIVRDKSPSAEII